MVLLAAMTWMPARAQDLSVADRVMTRSERVQQARFALERQDYALALAQADALLERWPRDENGLIIRAAVMLFGPRLDAAEAGRMLKRLPRDRRSAPDVEALDLWRDYRHGFNFMPTVRERLQMGRARDLLERDPTDPVANLVAGMMRVEDQRYLDNSARLSTGATSGDVISLMSYDAEAVINPETGRIQFENHRSAEPDIQVTWNDEPMREASEEAVRFLIRATATGPLHGVAVRYLTEAAIRGGRVRDAEMLLNEYVARHPESLKGYLYLGLLRYMLVKDDLAEVAFNEALVQMDTDEAAPWLDPRLVVSTSIASGYRDLGRLGLEDFWVRQDREWSRTGNERRVEHMGRMVYADLIWGREDKDLRGWETEPGQVLVRYGFPQARAQFQDEYSRYHILHYGSRYWLFEDIAKTEKPIFYSPPADAFQGGRAVMINDWALIAREQFRDNPLESELDNTGHMIMEVYPSVLEDDRGRTVIAPFCIRGAAFGSGSWVKKYERVAGAPVPPVSDSVRVARTTPCPSAVSVHHLDGRARQISLEIRNREFWSVGRFDIPAHQPTDHVRVSDIVLASLIEEHVDGDPEPTTAFVRNGLSIHPVAEPRFDRGAPLYIYAEAYGLDAREGRMLSVQAVLVEGTEDEVASSLLGRVFGRRDEAAVSVSFEDPIQWETQGRYLILETQGLAPGDYTLAIRMTEQASGRQAVSRRQIRID